MALQFSAVDARAFGKTRVADGQQCIVNKRYQQLVGCLSGYSSCLVHTTPGGGNKVYIGVCNSSYTQGHYCMFRSQPFAVGTRGVYGSSACERCDCNLHVELPYANKAQCDCKPTGTCYLDRYARFVNASSCPYLQPMCLITRAGGGGKDARGNRIDQGVCVAPQAAGPTCSSAGPTWRNRMYAPGATGVAFPGDPCKKCTCSVTGELQHCVHDPSCAL